MSYFNNETVLFKDGTFEKAAEAHLSLYQQTVHYGNGAFEGIRSYETPDGTRIFKAKEHFERLLFSAKAMHLNVAYTAVEMEALTYELLRRNNLTDAYIRPLVYAGESMSLTPSDECHLVIMAWKWDRYLGDQPLRVTLSPFQRPNPKSTVVEAKLTGHYTNSIMATREAKSRGFDEALLTDLNGFVAEAPGANFFLEKDGKLLTPALGNILPGITRATVMELAKELDLVVEERAFTPDEILTADAAFFCGTAAEVAAIKSFESYEFPLAWEESLGYLLQRRYKMRVSVNEYQQLYL